LEQNQKIMEQFLKLLSENGRAGQSEDLSRLLFYMDAMNRQLNAVRQELQTVNVQLAQMPQEAPQKNAVQGMVNALQDKVQQAQEKLNGLREKIMQCAANAVESFKRAGVTALDKAVSAMGIHKTLEAVQQNISGSLDDTKKSIEKVETLGHELRSAGGHLKNAGRTAVGKDTRQVDGGQEGRFQSAVLAPMRTVQKLLTNMNNATLAAIGNVERLETAAEAAREARKPPIRQEQAQEEKAKPEQEKKEPEPKAAPAVDTRREKTSIRQTLTEKTGHMSVNDILSDPARVKIFDTVLEESCRQWCGCINNAPERASGKGFAAFFYEVFQQKEQEYKAELKADTRSEKPSIRQTLNEKKTKAAALPAPDQERKAPEAAR